MQKCFKFSVLISGSLLFSVGQAAPHKTQALPTKTKKATLPSSFKVTPAMLRGKIVFVQGKDFWMMNPDGSGRKRFLTNPFGERYTSFHHIAISPDLTRIIFTSFPSENDLYAGNAIYSIRTDGTEKRQLVGAKGDSLRELRFSPDGKHLVYSRWTGSHGGGPLTSYADIWIMNADGSGRRRFIGDYSKYNAASCGARWSRDGKSVFYLRVEGGIPESHEMAPKVPEMLSINLDGTNARSAKGRKSQFLLDDVSPDGKRMIVNKATTADDGELYIEATDGSHSRRLTNNLHTQEFNAQFSPSGKQIVYNVIKRVSTTKISTKSYGIYIVNVDGSGTRQLPNSNQEFISYIQWLK